MTIFKTGLKTHPKVVKAIPSFLGDVGLIKVVSEFLFEHPKCHFWARKDRHPFFSTKKFKFGCPNENSETTLISPTSPKNDGIAFCFTRLPLFYGKIFYIGHTVRMSAEVCPEASPKIWRFTGWKKYFFLFITRKKRSVAFQPCITLGGVSWFDLAEKNDLSKKVP